MDQTITYKISGMHCTSCAMDIDFELEDLNGVKEAKTNYAKQEAMVNYDPKMVTTEQIMAVIKKLGYEIVKYE